MLITLIKYFSFALLVLVVGQTTIGSNTLAGHLQREMGKACGWKGWEIRKPQWLAGFAGPEVLTRWLKIPHSEPSIATGQEIEPEVEISAKENSVSEGVTPADRESILRLLQ